MKNSTLFISAICLALIGYTFATFCDNVDQKRDLRTLQNLLEWELMQQNFYEQGASQFSNNLNGVSEGQLANARTIKTHTDTYVQNLTNLITAKGGSPIQECSNYNFNFGSNSGDYLNKTIKLENWGNSLYLGAVFNTSNPAMQNLFASIASVKARHAAWLSGVLNKDPFRANFDSSISFSEAKRLVREEGITIENCPSENNQCFGVNANDANVCGGSSNGQCVAKNVCICRTGFKGNSCQETCGGGSNNCSACPDACCNDIRLGPVCFNNTTHACAASAENGTFVLCGLNEAVCNLWCFNPAIYSCVNESLVFRESSGGVNTRRAKMILQRLRFAA